MERRILYADLEHRREFVFKNVPGRIGECRGKYLAAFLRRPENDLRRFRLSNAGGLAPGRLDVGLPVADSFAHQFGIVHVVFDRGCFLFFFDILFSLGGNVFGPGRMVVVHDLGVLGRGQALRVVGFFDDAAIADFFGDGPGENSVERSCKRYNFK